MGDSCCLRNGGCGFCDNVPFPPVAAHVPVIGPRSCLQRHANLWFVLTLLLLQAPLWLNPGYFSHDELQWAARASGPTLAGLPWQGFGDWQDFQYRPLTFNLWMLLSRALFDTPQAFHLVLVLLGTFNAVLLASILRAAGVRGVHAWSAALVFALSPYAVWVQGWVGCLADLIWVAAGLAVLRILQSLDTGRAALVWAGLAAVLATAIGLLAKEAAISIPALLGLATLHLRFRPHWWVATLASGAVALIYLGLRLDVLLHPAAGTPYAIELWDIPRRWLAYQVFPWALAVGEIEVLQLASWKRWALLLILLLGLWWSQWRSARPLLLLSLLGGLLALAPALVLPFSSNQYGYGFMAVVCGLVAVSVAGLDRFGRATVTVLAVLCVAHGFQIQFTLYQVGRWQAVFSPSLAEVARQHAAGPIRLWAEDHDREFVLRRLTHQIPSYADVLLGDRVSVVDSADMANYWVAGDGRVRARP